MGGTLAALVGGLAMLSIAVPKVMPVSIIAAGFLGTYHASRIYRRLDAIMELLDADGTTAAEKGQSSDDRAA